MFIGLGLTISSASTPESVTAPGDILVTEDDDTLTTEADKEVGVEG